MGHLEHASRTTECMNAPQLLLSPPGPPICLWHRWSCHLVGRPSGWQSTLKVGPPCLWQRECQRVSERLVSLQVWLDLLGLEWPLSERPLSFTNFRRVPVGKKKERRCEMMHIYIYICVCVCMYYSIIYT